MMLSLYEYTCIYTQFSALVSAEYGGQWELLLLCYNVT